ncbi:hypothetical protein CMV_008760 [Castanea mollissima]|uniref:Uncharacterized protein n=1 Tax=Castanea mollissima TaxID=60419 RepID=A0A8J4RLA5_9ROSI|nr:hypothetical protein CMV_008760 [Castanea mollissima]
MDRQFSNHFPSETEGLEYEDRDVHLIIMFWGTEMPKWFNHQSVEKPIFFWVSRKFPKLAVGIVLGRLWFDGCVYISINSYKKRRYEFIRQRGIMCELYIFSPPQRSLQEHLNKSNPTDQNHVQVTYTNRYSDNENCIIRWGVHVECTCPPQESVIPNLPLLTAGHDDDDDDDDDVVDYMRELPFYVSDDKEEYQSPLVHDDDVDYWRELPFYGSNDKEEYQSPLVHDDTSMSYSLFIVVFVCFLLAFDDKLTGMVAIEGPRFPSALDVSTVLFSLVIGFAVMIPQTRIITITCHVSYILYMSCPS